MLCQQIINSVFSKNSFRYLELGLGTGKPFRSIQTEHKISVDINGQADFNEGTDKFFETYKGEKFDVIFIDANHEAKFVARDFNNSLNLIKDEGIIFLHDLFPPDERHCRPESCGDGYKILNYFIENGYDYYSILEDFGLTAVFTFVEIEEYSEVDYLTLLNNQDKINSVDANQLKEILTKRQKSLQ